MYWGTTWRSWRVMTDPRKTVVNWDAYRQCDGCRANTGEPCISLSGKVVNGHPDGCETPLERPHKSRRLRAARPGTYTALALAVRREARRREADADA